jgi:L-threonylcarbamoyladenylate synthase
MKLISHNTVAMRIPYGSEYLMNVLQEFGKPIISTSANITNTPFPLHYDDIANEIKR